MPTIHLPSEAPHFLPHPLLLPSALQAEIKPGKSSLLCRAPFLWNFCLLQIRSVRVGLLVLPIGLLTEQHFDSLSVAEFAIEILKCVLLVYLPKVSRSRSHEVEDWQPLLYTLPWEKSH